MAGATPLELVPYRVIVRNASRLKTGEIDRMTKMELTPRFNGVGSFELTMPLNYSKSSLMLKGGWIQVLSNDTGGEILSGHIRGRKKIWDDNNINGTLIVYGLSSEQILADRLAFQVPGSVATSQAASEYDRRSGVAETVIKNYVNLNAGPGAIVARRTSGFVMEGDNLRGSTVKGSARMSNLLDLIAPLAESGGIGFRVVFNASDNLEFQVFVPTDRTGTAKFGIELGNLVSLEHVEESAKSNAAIIGGQGDGTARVFREMLDSSAISEWGHRTETFIDRRDTTDTVELDQSGAEELVTNGPLRGLSIKTKDTPRLVFVRDYFVGDKVSVPEAGVSEVLRELTLTWDAEKGPTVETSVGSASTQGTKKLRGLLDKLNARVAALESKK